MTTNEILPLLGNCDVVINVSGVHHYINNACRVGNRIWFSLDNGTSYDVPVGADVEVVRIER